MDYYLSSRRARPLKEARGQKTHSTFEFLRHRNIENTKRYINLAKILFKDEQEYVTKLAHNVNESCALIEDGRKCQTGEYDDDGKVFAKSRSPLAPNSKP